MFKKFRDLAIKLRRDGNTYSEINKSLKTKIPKSTLSTWFKKINLTPKQKQILEENVIDRLNKSRQKALVTKRERRVIYLKYLKDKNLPLLSVLNKDTQKLLLSILYLGEGAKSKSTGFLSLASSNPKIIKLYLVFLKNCFAIDSRKFRVRIQCRADQNIKELVSYWQKITKIPRGQFYPTYIDKRTIDKPTLYLNYKGVCTLHYFDRSIQLELEILANSVIEYLTV